MFKNISLLAICFIILNFTLGSVFATDFRVLSPTDEVQLPEDLYYKPEFRSQWWYVTGHLKDESNQEYGFEQTFFIAQVNKKKSLSAFSISTLYIIHSALTDISGNKFFYQDIISRGEFDSAGASNNKFKIWLGKNIMEGDTKSFSIIADNHDFNLNLQLTNQKSIVRNGANGYSNKVANCPECASLYFSMTNLKASGTLTVKGKKLNVTGDAWFDREINSDSKNQSVKGWDWFGIMLDDDREIMLYNIRNKSGNIDHASSGMFINKNGSYRTLSLNDFTIKSTGKFTSKKTGITYPSGWQINIPSEQIDIVITPLLKDQEFVAQFTTFNTYWEGACSVEGSSHGKAYVELSGYESE